MAEAGKKTGADGRAQLRSLAAVDEVLREPAALELLERYPRELVVDDELMNGVCGQAPRRWPVGGNITSMRKLARCGPRMLS